MSLISADNALFNSQLEALKSIPVVFPDTYQAPPQLLPTRIAVFNLEVLPPPEKKSDQGAAGLGDVLNVTFKSLKPAYSVTLPIHPADSIVSLKTLLSSQDSPLAGTAPAQTKLLLKGKALLDTKLVKDYEIKEGSVITVMASKPPTTSEVFTVNLTTSTSTTDPTITETQSPMDLSAADKDPVPAAPSPALGTSSGPGHKRRVSDIPAVTLSPAGTPGATTPLLQPTAIPVDPITHVPLSPPTSINISSPSPGGTRSRSPSKSGVPLDLNAIPDPIMPTASTDASPYHQTLANPKFWLDLREFLEARFGKEAGGRSGDGDVAFEEFLRSAKVSLSPHEIAKIRDSVGITGLGGY